MKNQVDAKAVQDGDSITVYVSTADPRESSCVPREVHVAAVERSKARAEKNYAKADALQKKIVDSGYRLGYLFTFLHEYSFSRSSYLVLGSSFLSKSLISVGFFVVG